MASKRDGTTSYYESITANSREPPGNYGGGVRESIRQPGTGEKRLVQPSKQALPLSFWYRTSSSLTL